MAKFETYQGEDKTTPSNAEQEISAAERLTAEYEAARKRRTEANTVWKRAKTIADRKQARAEINKIEGWIEDIEKDMKKNGVPVPAAKRKEG